jgi:hypothetical protein
MGRLSLIHALSLVVLYARAGSPKFEPAAVRWLARLALEGRELRLNEIQLAAAALACLRGRRHERAEKTLLRLLWLRPPAGCPQACGQPSESRRKQSRKRCGQFVASSWPVIGKFLPSTCGRSDAIDGSARRARSG